MPLQWHRMPRAFAEVLLLLLEAGIRLLIEEQSFHRSVMPLRASN